MADIKQNDTKEHQLTLKSRRSLTMNGILDVVSFDESSVVLKTVCGELLIDGDELHISELDTSNGVVSVDGNIEALTYYESKTNEKKGRFGRFSK